MIPELAVEIISDAETANYSEDKAQQYLHAGVNEVWQIFANQKIIRARVAGEMRDWRAGDLLSSSALPGFSLAVASIF